MFAVDLDPDQRFDSIGTLDIETNGFDGSSDELVAIGVGYYEAGRETAEVEVITRAAVRGDERTLIENAYGWLNERTPDGLATYKGASFDLTFLSDRMEVLGFRERPTMTCADRHVDLYPARKRIADRTGRKWPSLEESLDAYDLPVYSTQWKGAELTNTRFGQDLAPRYLNALAQEDDSTLDELEPTIIEYTASDVEANIALYEADAGRTYMPQYSY